MKVAVTGASGFVGRRLVGRLADSGHQVRALVHRRRPERFIKDNIEVIEADVHDEASLIKAFQDVAAVFHLVGIIAETRRLTFQKTVVEGTAHVVAAARKNKVNQIVYLSGLGTSPDATTKYYQSKWQAEESIRNSGLGYTIFRASVIFGPEDQFINRFLRMIKKSPVIPIFGDGQYELQPINVDDVAELMVASLNNRKAYNEIIEIGGPDRLAFKEIVEMLKIHLNKGRFNIYLPWWLMRLGAALAEKLMKPAPVTRDQLTMLKDDSVCDNSRLHEIFDIKLTGLRESLKLYKR